MQKQSDDFQLNAEQILGFFALVLGMFMAILDIQIVASSLSEIAAGLSASKDELSWIQTSYLIAEVIIIPITGFAARLLSTRIFYFIAALGFTIMSVMCSLAWNIESMIVFRALQGLFGGAMIPTAFAAVMIIFPKTLHAKVNIIIGLTVTVAPTIGPTLGGYITEISSWHFMFLINIVPGIFVCINALKHINFDNPNSKLLNNFDFVGVVLLAIALGCLQYILEEGNKKDWFDDNHILVLSILCASSLIALIYRELHFSNPIVNLATFKNRNFTLGCCYSFIMGVGLFGSVYLLKLFLFVIAGYNTYQIGITMIVTGVFQFVSAPVAGRMFGAGVDKRLILAIGFFLFSAGCYANSFLTHESSYWEFFVPQMIRGLALMFCFMPVNDLALGDMCKTEIQNASGLYNLMRNLGGAIGLALINNQISNYSTILSQHMKDNISSTTIQIIHHVDNSIAFLGNKISDPEQGALLLIDQMIKRESFVIAINNVFVIISALFLLGIILLPLTRNPIKSLKIDEK